MLDSTSIRGRARPRSDGLTSAEDAERLWASLPHDNPMEMQRVLCDAIAEGANWMIADVGRFRAVRALDQRASRLLTGTLWEYASLGGQSPVLERKLWHTALEMSRSFANEFERYLRALRSGAARNGWQARTAEIVVRLFFHREIELVLTLFQYERWPRGRLKALHEAYRYALDAGCTTRTVPIGQRGDGAGSLITPEQAFVRVLLLQILDSGQFRPDEIVRARRSIGFWSAGACLQKMLAIMATGETQTGFIVDLAGAEGLVRSGATDSGDLLWLDTTPVAEAITAELARADSDDAKPGVDKAIQRNLQHRLMHLYAPQRRIVARRGERTAVALMSVEATVGRLQTIFRMLRGEARKAIAAAAGPAPYAEEITITDLSQTRASKRAHAQQAAAGDESIDPTTWHVRDRSASGCRLRGRKLDTRRLVPGMLIAFRDDALVPWTVGVVRRVVRIMGNNVEVGVEYLGRHPQRVVLVAADSKREITGEPVPVPERFIALYLPQSASGLEQPQKTLLMPACEFRPGRVLTMLSTTREMTVRCNGALEHQAEFVWSSFDVVDVPAHATAA
jgi:hypothetical protein